ncbi:AAA family ATPase [Persephonella sp.]
MQYLVEDIYSKFNRQVVILVDEYDRPVLNILHNIEEAEQLRIRFRDFYAGIKDIDSQIRLFFLT